MERYIFFLRETPRVGNFIDFIRVGVPLRENELSFGFRSASGMSLGLRPISAHFAVTFTFSLPELNSWIHRLWIPHYSGWCCFADRWQREKLATMESPEEPGASMDENYFVNYTFKDRSHSGRVAQGIMKLCLEEELFADVTISVEGREFQLHRLVLSAQSCFFRSMFTSNLKEAHNRVIVLQDVSESVFQLLVDYIYHGTVKLRAEELQEIYEVSDMYQLTSLFEECSRFLARTVQVGDCLQVMWLADRHSDPELYTAAKHCAKAHLAQLQSTDEFLHLPHHLLTDIISGKLRERGTSYSTT